jgi:hypothetical protein
MSVANDSIQLWFSILSENIFFLQTKSPTKRIWKRMQLEPARKLILNLHVGVKTDIYGEVLVRLQCREVCWFIFKRPQARVCSLGLCSYCNKVIQHVSCQNHTHDCSNHKQSAKITLRVPASHAWCKNHTRVCGIAAYLTLILVGLC